MSPDEISGGREPGPRPPADPRGRRRRVLGVVALGIVVAAASSTILLTRPSRRHPSAMPTTEAPIPTSPTAPASAPVTTASATPGPPVGTVPVGADGIALLADPGPEIVDVTGGKAAALAAGYQSGAGIGLSPDGRYVAAISGTDDATVEILDRADDVVSQSPGTSAAWSPLSDTLAVVGGTGGLRFVTPGRDSVLVRAPGVATDELPGGTDLAWSPDGRLAVGTAGRVVVIDPRGDVQATSPVVHDALPEPVAWAGDHLLVFDRTGSGSLDSDGVTIVTATVSGSTLTFGPSLGEGLPLESWWHTDGGDDLLGTLGPDRDAASDKRVVRCDLATARCTTLAGGSRTSTFGVEPTAAGIAYLSTPNAGDNDNGTAAAGLVLADRDGDDARAAEGAPPSTQIVAIGDVLLLAADSGGRASIDRYDAGAVTVLTAVAAGGLYQVDAPEIVAWWRPGNAVAR